MAADERAAGGTRYEAAVAVVAEPDSVLLPGHDVPLGRYTTVRRLLPQRPRRLVGAWCFVDHFGPDDVAGRPGMRVPPHPHTGLQTVTWLVEGEIFHRDSLGNQQSVVPGQLNLMTSGHGIAHSEESPPDHPPVMHGLQLWVALPDGSRHIDPDFAHHPAVPVVREGDLTVTVVVGEVGGARSPARVHTPLVGAELRLSGAGEARLPLTPGFEYAVLVMTGAARVAGTPLTPGSLLYLGRGRSDLALRADAPARLFLLGGEPFEEPLVMWWNFVARSHEEIAQARADWQAGRRFGTVAGYPGDPLPAPAMPTVRLKARDRHGRTIG
jgi:redox-sensitive bicupin YhaK (pirin superfamily)